MLVFTEVQSTIPFGSESYASIKARALFDWSEGLPRSAFAASHNDILAVPIKDSALLTQIPEAHILDLSAEEIPMASVVKVYGYPGAEPIRNPQGFETCTYMGAKLSFPPLLSFQDENTILHRLHCPTAFGEGGLSGGLVVYQGKLVGIVTTGTIEDEQNAYGKSSRLGVRTFTQEFVDGNIAALSVTPHGTQSFAALSLDNLGAPYVIEANFNLGSLHGVTKYLRKERHSDLDKTIAWFAMQNGHLDETAPLAASYLSCAGKPVRSFFYDPAGREFEGRYIGSWMMMYRQFWKFEKTEPVSLPTVFYVSKEDVGCPNSLLEIK